MRRFVCLFLLCFCVGSIAGPWDRFRGPNGSGTSESENIPVTWTAKDFLWQSPLPGTGHSSPVLWKDRLFLTAAENKGTRYVLCLRASDGKQLWKHISSASRYKMHKQNTAATSTPAVDQDHVYVCWGTPKESVIMALDHTGKKVWEQNLGPYPSQHGYGVSPIVHEGLVIVQHQPDGKGTLYGIEAKTGTIRWRVPRTGKNATYSTPCVRTTPAGKSEVIFTNWQHGMTAIDPATGKINWELSIFTTTTNQRAIGSPVLAGNYVLGVAGFITGAKRLVAVDPGKDAKAKEIWRLEDAVPQMSTPVVKGDRVFVCTEQGFASWLDLQTGKVIWKKRIGGAYTSSPVWIGKAIYCTSKDGKVVVLEAADTFHLLAENPLGGETQSTPAIGEGKLFFRTENGLMCVGKKASQQVIHVGSLLKVT